MMMLADTALDIDQFLNTDLFQPQSPQSPASTPSSPEQGLLTPPQQAPAPSFHDAASEQLPFSFFDDEIKAIDALTSSTPFDFLSHTVAGGSLVDHTMSGFGGGIPMDLGYAGIPGFNMNMGFGLPADDALQAMAIDPQLVDTPASAAPISDFDEHDQDGDDEQSTNSAGTSPAAAPSPSGSTSSSSKLTLTIAPIKVGGHGKARRGTVQSGGISKKSAVGSTTHISALQHHAAQIPILPPLPTASSSSVPSPTPSLPEAAPAFAPATTATSTPSAAVGGNAKGLPKPPAILKATSSKKGKGKDNNIKDPILEDDEDDDVPQDWRPSPEVFAKMTSKEKRQLRNKISARNFRVRRKEYISTLEGDIAERDRLLEAVRSELGSTQSENLALRQEIAALKKVLLEGANGATDLPSLNLPPPAPLPVGLGAITAATATAASPSGTTLGVATNAMGAGGMVPSPPGTPAPTTTGVNATVSTSSPSSAPTPSTSTSAAFTPNIQKDLPSSPIPGRPFWGGQQHHGLGAVGGSGITPVHTTLIPEINVSLWGSVANAGNSTMNGVEREGKNINPLLNAIGAGVTGKARLINGVYVPGRGEKEPEKENKQPPVLSPISGFDAFADANMFTMKSLDAYRMQLWGKMAAQHHIQQQQQSTAVYQHQPYAHQNHQHQLTGPASQLRPAYFSSPSSLSPKSASSTAGLGSTLSALLSGKHSATSSSSSPSHGLLTPPASPRLGARGSNTGTNTNTGAGAGATQREREAQAAMLAAVASQTLFKKLGSAFWDAFSGSSSIPTIPSSTNTNAGASPSSSTQVTRNWDADKVRKVLEGKAVVRVIDVDPFTHTAIAHPSPTMTATTPTAATMSSVTNSSRNGNCGGMSACCANVTDLLEESMRSLTLGVSRSTGAGAGAGEASK